MSVRDTRWQRLRRQLGPVTRRIPYGHLITETATYARLLMPGLRRPSTRFVIFAQGRSGSTLLADLLNCHPRVYCADEILTWKRIDPARYARACSVGHRQDTYGFKVKIYQLTDAQRLERPGELLRRLHDEGWLVLFLQRRNVLRQALSSMVAAQRRVYHEPVGARNGPQPVHIDPEDLLRRATERQQLCEEEAVALEGIPHQAFSYEDDLLRRGVHQETADRAFAYLGLDAVPVSAKLRKIGDRPLAQIVANHEALLAAVGASPFADLLASE